MALRGETLATGASPTCLDCGITPKLRVCHSAAGYYIGTFCDCGPYSRETGYFQTRKEAQIELKQLVEDGDFDSLRTTDFNPAPMKVTKL